MVVLTEAAWGPTVSITDVPQDASVVINVAQAGDVTIPKAPSITLSSADGTVSSFHNPESVSPRILWNFANATSVALGDGAGTDQFPGTVLLANTSSTLTTRPSANGKILTLGDYNAVGGGQEHHSFPFQGMERFLCVPTSTPEPADPQVPTEEVPVGEPPAEEVPSEETPTGQQPTEPEPPTEPEQPVKGSESNDPDIPAVAGGNPAEEDEDELDPVTVIPAVTLPVEKPTGPEVEPGTGTEETSDRAANSEPQSGQAAQTPAVLARTGVDGAAWLAIGLTGVVVGGAVLVMRRKLA